MRKAFLALLLVLAGAGTLRAQFTTVSATVKDPNGQLYANGFYTVQFVDPGTSGMIPLINGSPFQKVFGPIPLDSAGHFSVTVGDNNYIASSSGATGTTWTFHICSQQYAAFDGSRYCFNLPNVTVTGATQDLSAALQAASVNLPPPAGATVPAGNPGDLQTNGGSGNLGASHINDTGSVLNASEPLNVSGDITNAGSLHPKGPAPYTDFTQYGVRAVAPNAAPAIAGVTASITGGQGVATISTNTCASQTGSVCFKQGDGVTIYGAGATVSLTTPTAPTVTPMNTDAGTGTGSGVAAPSGATTFNYKVLACDLGGGCTAASTMGTTTTGNALGAQSMAITGITRSNDTLTFTTTSQPPFSVGTEVHVDGCSGTNDNVNGFCGWFRAATVTGTGFTATSTTFDTRQGATTTSAGGATANWWNYNHVAYTGVTGAAFYVIQSDRQTPGTFVNIGMSWMVDQLNGEFTDGTLYFDDFGQTMMANSALSIPPFVPTNGSASNDNLTTTITAINGTSLTLVANATNTVTGATILFDDAPNIVVANSAVSGPLLFPVDPNGGTYVTNSFVNLTTHSQNPWIFSGSVLFNETVFAQGPQWFGNIFGIPATNTQFESRSLPAVTFGSMVGLLSEGGGGTIRGLQLAGAHNGIAFMQDGGGGAAGPIYDDDNFIGASASGDYMSMAFVCRGASGASCVFDAGKVLVYAGTQSMTDTSFTPGIFLDDVGQVTFKFIMASGRGGTINFKSDSSGGLMSVGAYHMQAPTAPIVTVNHGLNGIGYISIGFDGQAIIDTGAEAAIFNPQAVGVFVDCGVYGCGTPASALPGLTGGRVSMLRSYANSAGSPGAAQQVNLTALTPLTCGQSCVTGVSQFGTREDYLNDDFGASGTSVFMDAPVTGFTATATGSGTWASGTYTVQIAGWGWNNEVGIVATATVAVNGSQAIQVACNVPVGYQGVYIAVDDRGQGTFASCPQTLTHDNFVNGFNHNPNGGLPEISSNGILTENLQLPCVATNCPFEIKGAAPTAMTANRTVGFADGNTQTVLAGTLTTTSATSDSVTIQGLTASGHCSLTSTNASAATNIATTYVSGIAANSVTVTHTGTSGMTYNIFCTAN